MVFAFWPRQENDLKAPERNRGASNAFTARKLHLDAPGTTRMAAVLARLVPNRFLKTKTERGGGERKKRKRSKEEKGEREKRRKQTAPHQGPSVARVKRALLLHGRSVFLLLLLLLLLASVTKYIQNAF